MQISHETMSAGSVVPMVAIISNPKSTTNSANMDEVRQVIKNTPNVVHFELRDIKAIDEAMALFARATPSVIIINGGDGTIGMAMASLLYRNPFKVTPPIAFLPGGKTNMTAADLGYKGKPHKVLKKILQAVHSGEIVNRTVRRRVIELDLGDGSDKKVGTFFGAAGIVKGILWTRENAYSTGLPNGLAHVMALGKLLLSALGLGVDKSLMASAPMDITVKGGGRLSGEYSFVSVTSLDKLLLGVKPFPREGAGGLGFSAIEVGGRTVLRAAIGLIFTRTFGKKGIGGVHVRRSDEVTIETTDPVTLDGEIYTPKKDTPVTLSGTKSLTFMKL
ncbi:diacylglycerol kinase [Kordiimonas sediminis]|uniref:Diacylglycerol kinase n=1 Tax=Kordiimonas sediminis TaxID=1735581 RepID=A0A919E8I1_9PROT|nr:diacylglycerol kinase family protein [Kordiimonas sediminis]GHF25217.1 diacylglycerol kinase [Kordiimonas sediminis]